MTPGEAFEERFLVVAPTGRDAQLAVKVLAQAQLDALACPSIAALCSEAARGAAGLLVAEEALTASAVDQLVGLLEAQPSWSDLAIVLFTGTGVTAQTRVPTAESLAPLGNVTLLDRPVRPVSLVSTARSILRGRRRQYTARAELVRREAAMRERDRFLAMLGHELRNPLNAVSLAVGLMRRGADPKRLVDMIERQTRTLDRLVDDLLQVSRLTSGKVELRRERVDLHEVVVRTLAGLEGRREHRTIVVHPPTGDARACIDGDPVRIEQVVVNLLSNAIKYTNERGRIDVTIDVADAQVTLTIRDDGVGIPPDVLPHVFDMFVQADVALDRAQGGLGIGLALVKGLVDLHGGEVEAHSDGADRGSTFVVRLPLATPGGSLDAAKPRPAAASRRRILVVEDDPDARALTRDVLVAAGHQVDVAHDGAEGLSRALSLRPDVLVVDIGLPGLDGYGVARGVRDALGDTVRLIALTGYGQPEDRARALDAGFDRHLMKPIDATKLEGAIDEITGGS